MRACRLDAEDDQFVVARVFDLLQEAPVLLEHREYLSSMICTKSFVTRSSVIYTYCSLPRGQRRGRRSARCPSSIRDNCVCAGDAETRQTDQNRAKSFFSA